MLFTLFSSSACIYSFHWLFVICGSVLLSLLPLLVKHDLGLNSTGFGLLFGAFGIGGVLSGLELLPKLRRIASQDSLITTSTRLLAVVVFAMAYVREISLLFMVIGIGGLNWIIIFSNLGELDSNQHQSGWSKVIRYLFINNNRWYSTWKRNMG
ncbi:MAG: MFS transporter [Thermoproteota archaeon]|nr:MFS transporter [Thermoproteota archaeon]